MSRSTTIWTMHPTLIEYSIWYWYPGESFHWISTATWYAYLLLGYALWWKRITVVCQVFTFIADLGIIWRAPNFLNTFTYSKTQETFAENNAPNLRITLNIKTKIHTNTYKLTCWITPLAYFRSCSHEQVCSHTAVWCGRFSLQVCLSVASVQTFKDKDLIVTSFVYTQPVDAGTSMLLLHCLRFSLRRYLLLMFQSRRCAKFKKCYSNTILYYRLIFVLPFKRCL